MADITRANELLDKLVKNESLKKHMYSVESCMRFYAEKLVADEESWAAAGLLHDLDWEAFPETHPNTAVPYLKEAGFNDEIIQAILGHAYPDRTDVPRTSDMAKYLYACDELAGFIIAYSLMKPDGINSVDARGVKKKMKDKAFARNVNREDIMKGVEEIGISLDEHIDNIIFALKNDERLRK
jgi:predicted hydrolase (HD superfamily)